MYGWLEYGTLGGYTKTDKNTCLNKMELWYGCKTLFSREAVMEYSGCNFGYLTTMMRIYRINKEEFLFLFVCCMYL